MYTTTAFSLSNMEPAAATADFESQPGVLPTATESQPDLFVSVDELSQAQPASNGPTGRFILSLVNVFLLLLADLVGVAAGTTRPRRGDKTPASFADYAVIKPVRSQRKKRGRPPKKSAAEAQPAQPQQQELVEHDDLSAALAIPGLPALPDFGAAVREA
jgi:hypothetical protein